MPASIQPSPEEHLHAAIDLLATAVLRLHHDDGRHDPPRFPATRWRYTCTSIRA